MGRERQRYEPLRDEFDRFPDLHAPGKLLVRTQVVIRGGYVVAAPVQLVKGRPRGIRVVTPSQKVLWEFVKLAADRDGSAIRAFAETWGMLEACSHGYVRHVGCDDPPRWPLRDEQRERLVDWRRRAAEASACLDAAVAFKSAAGASPELLPATRRIVFMPDEAPTRHRFASWMDRWLKCAGVGPRLTWYGDGAAFEPVAFQGAWSAAAAYAAAVVASGFERCHWCQRPIQRDVRPGGKRSRRANTGTRACCGREKCRAARMRSYDANRSDRRSDGLHGRRDRRG